MNPQNAPEVWRALIEQDEAVGVINNAFIFAHVFSIATQSPDLGPSCETPCLALPWDREVKHRAEERMFHRFDGAGG